jgi:hypothetical protein
LSVTTVLVAGPAAALAALFLPSAAPATSAAGDSIVTGTWLIVLA